MSTWNCLCGAVYPYECICPDATFFSRLQDYIKDDRPTTPLPEGQVWAKIGDHWEPRGTGLVLE